MNNFIKWQGKGSIAYHSALFIWFLILKGFVPTISMLVAVFVGITAIGFAFDYVGKLVSKMKNDNQLIE